MERKRRRLSEADLKERSERAFKAYREPMENLTKFRYLERVLMAGYDDWLVVVEKLGKAQKRWGWLSRILIREGAHLKVLGKCYKVVAQAVFLFGAEMWVLTPRMERALEIFHHRVERRITEKQPMRQGNGSWEYPPLVETMGEAGLEEIRKSITRRQ